MGFNRIFLGFLFILFDFRIQGIDILPDVIGYFIIYSGLRNLSSKDGNFEKASKYVVPLLLLSIFDIYQVQRPLGSITMSGGLLLFWLTGIILSILNLLMVYHVCLGISRLAHHDGNVELENIASKRWRFYFYVALITMVFVNLGVFIPGLATLLFLPVSVASFAAFLLLLGLLRRAEEALQI